MNSEKRPQPIRPRDPFRRVERRRAVYRFIGGMIAIVLLVVCSLRYGVLAFPPPWKILTPGRIGFNAESFRFTDYRNSKAFAQALNGMFPPGTPKATVDRILGGSGGATIKLFSTTGAVKHYAYRFRDQRSFISDMAAWLVTPRDRVSNWYVVVKFDRADRLIDLSATVDEHDRGGHASYTNITPVYRPPE